MADVVLKRHCKLLSFFTIIIIGGKGNRLYMTREQDSTEAKATGDDDLRSSTVEAT